MAKDEIAWKDKDGREYKISYSQELQKQIIKTNWILITIQAALLAVFIGALAWLQIHHYPTQILNALLSR